MRYANLQRNKSMDITSIPDVNFEKDVFDPTPLLISMFICNYVVHFVIASKCVIGMCVSHGFIFTLFLLTVMIFRLIN